MNNLIAIQEIPDEDIEIIVEPQQTYNSKSIVVNQIPPIFLIKLLKTFLYLFVLVMILWLFGVFSGCIETGLTVTYTSLAIFAIIIRCLR